MELFVLFILFLCFPLLLSSFFTALLCRFRMAREKRIGKVTALQGALIVPVLFILLGAGIDPSFSDLRDPKGPGIWLALIFLGLITAVLFLPSAAVVAYYQKRSKRDETRTV